MQPPSHAAFEFGEKSCGGVGTYGAGVGVGGKSQVPGSISLPHLELKQRKFELEHDHDVAALA